MHAYLILGDKDNINPQIDILSKKLNSKVLDFPLAKISDVRNLNDLTSLTFKEPTLIVCKNIDQSTEEALNAFLKNLEEPQENLYFVLTATSEKNVLPTIVSRCQIIRSKNVKIQNSNESLNTFLNSSPGQKLLFTDKINKKEDALNFLMNLITYSREKITNDLVNPLILANYLQIFLDSLNNIKANGNVSLQLTNLIVRMESPN